MYSYGPPHMAEQKQNDQLEHTYSIYVSIRDIALKTCQRRWTIGRSGERGSGISVQAARHDDDDDNDDLSTAKVNSNNNEKYNKRTNFFFTLLNDNWNLWRIVWMCVLNGFLVYGQINFRGLFNAKAILVKEQPWYHLNHGSGIRFHVFPQGISPKITDVQIRLLRCHSLVRSSLLPHHLM